jgi:peptidoglycan/LPS O-acetylase OafA/YrhL
VSSRHLGFTAARYFYFPAICKMWGRILWATGNSGRLFFLMFIGRNLGDVRMLNFFGDISYPLYLVHVPLAGLFFTK